MRKLLLLTFLALASAARAETVTFTTENYPPFSYQEGDTLKGADIEQVQMMMEAIGMNYTIALLPWARAYMLAQTTPMTCVIGTAHKPDRDKLFKWVEPLLIDRNVLVAREGSGVHAASLEEAKSYTVGTWRGDYTQSILEKNGFQKIDVSSEFTAALKKLMNDRIDLIPISEFSITKLKREGRAIRPMTLLSAQPLGIACQRDFPDSLLRKMQETLDKLISDGTQQALFEKYGIEPLR